MASVATSYAKKLRCPVKSQSKSTSPKGVTKKLGVATLRFQYASSRVQAKRLEGEQYGELVTMTDRGERELSPALSAKKEKLDLEKFPAYDERLALELLSSPEEVFAISTIPFADFEDYEAIFNRPPQLATFTGRLPPGLENQIMQRHMAYTLDQQLWNGWDHETVWNVADGPIFAADCGNMMMPVEYRIGEMCAPLMV